MKKRKLVEIGAGLGGINDYRPKEELDEDGEPGIKYVADCRNFDIDNEGRLRSRKGRKRVYAGDCHSLFSHHGISYFREGDTLKSLIKIGSLFITATIATGIPAGRRRMWYAPVNDCIYYSDGVVTGVIQNGQSRAWGITPPPLPVLRGSPVGSLPQGTYQAAVTYVRNDGYESGAVGVVRIEASGGFSIDYAASGNPAIVSINIYISARGTDTLYLVYSTGANHSGTYLYDGTTTLSVPLNTMFEYPPAAGQLVEFFYGYMLIASGNVLFYSEPYRYESFKYASNFMVFENRITLLCAVKDGLFVGTDTDIYFLQGTDILQLRRFSVAGYGAVYGSPTRGKPYADVVYFLSRRGICRVTTGGQLENLTDDVIYVDTGDDGAGYYREQGGIEQYIVSMTKPHEEQLDDEAWDTYNQRIDVEMSLPALNVVDNVAHVGLPRLEVKGLLS
ncbi:MAG: hypothetical protein HQK97_04645 [Nitrospirae bacterium]|nr:hypothetical protein [Nitrospirota bacterium]